MNKVYYRVDSELSYINSCNDLDIENNYIDENGIGLLLCVNNSDNLEDLLDDTKFLEGIYSKRFYSKNNSQKIIDYCNKYEIDFHQGFNNLIRYNIFKRKIEWENARK